MLSIEVNSYIVILNPAWTLPDGVHAGHQSILLYDTTDRFFARINFRPNEDLTGMQATTLGGLPWFHISYPLSDYQVVIDILRNEKPVYLHFEGTQQLPMVYLSTFREPIGEGEDRV
jgi:hypothetical protein